LGISKQSSRGCTKDQVSQDILKDMEMSKEQIEEVNTLIVGNVTVHRTIQ